MYVEKLKSGLYRIKVPIGKGTDGKYHYKSVSAKKKADCIAAANKLMAEDHTEVVVNDSLGDMMQKFNLSKDGVLSPATMREYKRLAEKEFENLKNKSASQLNNYNIQQWINLYASTHSPKSVTNAYGYLCSVFSFAGISKPKVNLPQKKKVEYHVITDEELKEILLWSGKHDQVLYLSILLAYNIPARRGEICALTEADIDRKNNIISINKDIVGNADGEWIVKPPKTFGSYRKVKVDKRIIQSIPVGMQWYSPSVLEHHFHNMMVELGLDFRFHDLRHYGCTVLMNSGVPLKTVCYMGGWQDASTPLKIYSHYTEESMEQAESIMRIHNNLTFMDNCEKIKVP